MTSRRRFIAALLASLAPCAASAATTRRVLVVGDSEACAVAPYVRRVAPPTDDVAVECLQGTTVGYWGAQGHLAQALARHPRPDAVVVFLGTNHYWQAKAPDVVPVTAAIEATGASCTWVGNVAVAGRKWPIDGLMRAAVEPACTYYDTEAAGIPLVDGMHPTAEGALLWLRAVWPTIKEGRRHEGDR